MRVDACLTVNQTSFVFPWPKDMSKHTRNRHTLHHILAITSLRVPAGKPQAARRYRSMDKAILEKLQVRPADRQSLSLREDRSDDR